MLFHSLFLLFCGLITISAAWMKEMESITGNAQYYTVPTSTFTMGKVNTMYIQLTTPITTTQQQITVAYDNRKTEWQVYIEGVNFCPVCTPLSVIDPLNLGVNANEVVSRVLDSDITTEWNPNPLGNVGRTNIYYNQFTFSVDQVIMYVTIDMYYDTAHTPQTIVVMSGAQSSITGNAQYHTVPTATFTMGQVNTMTIALTTPITTTQKQVTVAYDNRQTQWQVYIHGVSFCKPGLTSGTSPILPSMVAIVTLIMLPFTLY